MHWLDSGELTAASLQLVGAHAPGEPVYIMLGKAASLIPLGSIAFRLNLLSALCGAAAAWFLYDIALQLPTCPPATFSEMVSLADLTPATSSETDSLAPYTPVASSDTVSLASHTPTASSEHAHIGPSASARALAALTLTPFLTYPLWIQSVRAEVYALELALVLAMLAALIRAGLLQGRLEPRWTLAATFCLGLNLAVHPLLAALVMLPLALAALFRPGFFQPRLWALAVAVGTLGFSAHLMLPLRAVAHPSYGWGRPQTLHGLVDLLLARDFQQNFSPLTLELVGRNLVAVVGALIDAAGPVPLLLALAGLAILFLGGERRTAAVLGAMAAAALWSILPQNKVYGANPDFQGYLGIVHVLIWLLAAVAVARAAARIAPVFPAAGFVAPLIVAVLALTAVGSSFADSNRRDDTLARELGLAALAGLPAGGVLQVSGNDTMFVLGYLQQVERRRPDVLVLPRTLLSHAWYRARLPYDQAWQVAAGGPVGALAARIAPRALRVELREVDLPYARQLCPVTAPGWGFYDLLPACPLLIRNVPPESGGLTVDPRARTGPEAMLVGLNARAFLADFYDAIGRSDWALRERTALEQLMHSDLR